MTTLKPVFIIGSGLSGLALAQALKRHSIPFRIYERDTASDQRAQGYRIRINDYGLEALRKCLPEDVYRHFEDTTAENLPMGPRVAHDHSKSAGPGRQDQKSAGAGPGGTPSTGPSNPSVRGGPPRGPGFFSLPADRKLMRSALLSGLEDSVSYDKAFADYTIFPTGIVAHFTDGTSSTEGSLLVGADGVHSKVSRKLAGDALLPRRLESWMIFGKTLITTEVTEALSPELTGGMKLTPCPSDTEGQIILFTEPMRFRHAGAPPDYMYWVVLSDKSKLGLTDEQLSNLDSEAAADVANRVAQNWPSDIKPIIDHQDPQHTSALQMTTADPKGVPTWPTSARVTLIGDAVHCMPPTGGSGANTALRDAALLSEKLKDGLGPDGWNADIIGEFEREMLEYANQWVLMSYEAATKRFGVQPLMS